MYPCEQVQVRSDNGGLECHAGVLGEATLAVTAP